MLEYNPQKPILSWLPLILIPSGTAGATCLLWKIHWIAGVSVSVPVWILLYELLVNRRESIATYLIEFLQEILAFGGSVITVSFLWKIHWILGAVAAIPVFVLLFILFGFLTLPLHFLWCSKEERVARKVLKGFFKGNYSAPKREPEADS